jgi:capsular polysaccharide biosynthesis protein
MDVSGSLHTLRKHWVLTSLLVLLTLVAAVGVWVGIPGPYSSESQVVFLASQQSSKLNGNNPYMSFNGTLSTTADLVRRELMDPRIVAQLTGRGYTAGYEVVDDPAATGPILDVNATGKSKAMVEATQLAATREVQTVLLQLQSGIAPGNQITSMVVASAPNASLLVSKKARPLVGVLVVGLLLTLAIPQMVDAPARRRRERAQQPRQAPIPMPATAARRADDADRSAPVSYTASQRIESRDPDRAEPPWHEVASPRRY